MVNIFNLFTLLLESQSTSCCGDSVSRPFPALKILYIKLSRFQPEMIELFRFESFPQISNIRIWIRQFLSPNIIQIFESFSSNLEYLKHIFSLNFEFKLGNFRCPGDLLIPFAGTNGQDLCLDVTVTWYLKELFEYALSIPAFCFSFSIFCSNIAQLFE